MTARLLHRFEAVGGWEGSNPYLTVVGRDIDFGCLGIGGGEVYAKWGSLQFFGDRNGEINCQITGIP